MINIIPTEKITGISVWYKNANDFEISYCILQSKKNKITLVEKRTGINSFEELRSYLDKKIPQVLAVYGKSTLSWVSDDEPDEKAVYELLPNVNRKEVFEYVSSDPEQKNGYHVLSVARSNIIQNILKELLEHGFFILNLELGIVGVCNLWNLKLLPENNSIKVSDMIIDQTKSFQLSKATKEESVFYKIGDDQFDENTILPFAITFNQLLKAKTGYYLGQSPALNAEEFRYFKRISMAKYPLLAVIFIVLLVNFMIFSSLQTKNDNIKKQIEVNKGMINTLDSLENDYRQKKELMSNLGETHLQYSHLLDYIGQTLPKDLFLGTLMLNAPNNKIKEGERIEFNLFILIEGKTRNSKSLNIWIKTLEKHQWISEVEVINYEHNAEEKYADFSLKILY